MTNRALIVGISEYAPLASNLPSSLVEIENWRSLLVDCYRFSPYLVDVLANRFASRSMVLNRLSVLLGDTEAGDQRVLIFCGHGLRLHRNGTAGTEKDHRDEGLVLYPAGATNPLDVTLFDDELASLYRHSSVRAGTLVTFIFDSCYSGGLDFSDTARISSTDGIADDLLSDYDRTAAGIVRIGLHLGHFASAAPPVVIAAAGEAERAVERDDAGAPRSLFSSLATAVLKRTPSLSYAALIQSIAPWMRYAAQVPILRGDMARAERPFLN
jgi:hypothetical protein